MAPNQHNNESRERNAAHSLADKNLALPERSLNAFTGGNVSAVLLTGDWNFLALSTAAINLPSPSHLPRESCSWAFGGEQRARTGSRAELGAEERCPYTGGPAPFGCEGLAGQGGRDGAGDGDGDEEGR